MNKIRIKIISLICVAVLACSTIVYLGTVGHADSLGDIPTYAEIPLEDEIKLFYTGAFGFYRGAGLLFIDLPGYTMEFACDNAYLCDWYNDVNGRRTPDGEFYKSYTAENVYCAFVCGRTPGTDIDNYDDRERLFYLQESDATVRVIIKDGERIAGYALICFWGADISFDAPKFESGKIVKAVMFDKVDGEYPDVTADEVNKLLDEARDELVVKAKLFDTKEILY